MVSPLSPSRTALAQLLIVGAGLAGAVLMPPANGAMLAVPLTGANAAETINLALANGATLERTGPLPGSIVLRGERARLAGPLRARGVVLLAASLTDCGE